jgi:hypothetical protein
MSNQNLQSEKWETEIEKRLRKLHGYLKYKNHGFCRKYLSNILIDFFKTGAENTKKRKVR